MAYDKQKVIDVALAEVGYLEKASASQLYDKTANAGKKNYTKYAEVLDALGFFNGRKQGFAWCAVWVCWDFVQAYGVDAAKKLLCLPAKAADNCAAGCGYLRKYFLAKGQFHTSDPQPGDVVIFYSSDKSSYSHTGLVYKVDRSKVYTLEGNTSGASGVVANGGGVCKKSYSLSYGRIAGYGRPKYGENSPAVAPVQKDKETVDQSTGGATAAKTTGKAVTVELVTLSKGSEGEQVRTLQRLLLALNYDVGDVDGEFGTRTEAAVKKFQLMVGLDVDGIVGRDTWTALLT